MTIDSPEFKKWYDNLCFAHIIANLLKEKAADLPMLKTPYVGGTNVTPNATGSTLYVLEMDLDRWKEFLAENGFEESLPYSPIKWNSIAEPEYTIELKSYRHPTNSDCFIELWVYSPINKEAK